MSIGKFLSPKNDLAFKRIFGTEKNKDILIHFLNDIFGHTTNPIEHVTFLKTSQEPEVAAQRVSVVDILCEDLEKNKFIIEMQVTPEKGFERRAQYYAAKTYIEQRTKDVLYQDLKAVTFLAITEFTLFPNKNAYLSHHHMMDQETHERDLKDFSFSFLELPKFKKSKDDLITMTEKWAYFFKHAAETEERDLDEITGDDFIIKRAYEELNRYSWSVEELRTYDGVDLKRWSDQGVKDYAFDKGMEEGLEKGMEKGMEKGIEQGLEKGEEIGTHKTKYNIARAMKKMGITVNKIVEATELTQEEVNNL